MTNEWSESLDALKAAPEYHVLLFENEHVRVLDTKIPAGQTVPLHTHRWSGALYVLSWSDFVRRDEEGRVVVDSRVVGMKPNPGTALWSGPLEAHTLENVGTGELRVIVVEVKSHQS